MSQSPNLSLPFIQPSQAQKHVTHNLAIERLDALVQMSVSDLQAAAPPADPPEGELMVVATGATGEFAGEDGKLAYRTNGAWLFITPRNGFKAWVESLGAFYVHRNGLWYTLSSMGDDTVAGLGLNTTWDMANRLSVASPATLLTHEGAGHQLKVNKASAEETASLLFQQDFSGRAEMGLAGNDDFSLKVSADGAAWSTALTVDAATGDLEAGRIDAVAITGEAVQSAPTDTTPGRLMRADWGYGPANVVGTVSEVEGVPTGAVIESGQNENGHYVRYADGTQIMIVRDVSKSAAIAAGATLSGTWTYPASASNILHVFATVRTYASVSATEFAAQNISTAATPFGSSAAWAVFAKSATNAVRVDITAIGRWF